MEQIYVNVGEDRNEVYWNRFCSSIIIVQTECDEWKVLKINKVTSYATSNLTFSSVYPTEIERWTRKPKKINDLDMWAMYYSAYLHRHFLNPPRILALWGKTRYTT